MRKLFQVATRQNPANRTIALVALVAITLLGAVGLSSTAASDRGVRLRSGTVQPGRAADTAVATHPLELQRMIVRFKQPPGRFERGRLEAAGARIEAPLPGQAYLVSVPAARSANLKSLAEVDWATPYRPQDKLSPEIMQVGAAPDSEPVVVLLHLFAEANARAVADELTASGYRVLGDGNGRRFDRIVLEMTPQEVELYRQDLAERNDVFWIGQRFRRTLQNDSVVWVDQSGLDGNELTPIFDHGIHGEGQIGAVLDTGVDADACYFRDGTLGLPPTNVAGGTTVDTNQRKIIAVDFLDPAEDPADPTHWDTQGHGSHVAGTMVGDDLANPVDHDSGDGMAPAAKVIIQDAGFANDNCGDLPGIGCPVTDLVPVFQQAYDQGARVHNNSWNDNENALVQNTYTDASQDVDEFVWNNPEFLILFGAGNRALGGVGTMGSPGTCKNGMAVGATYNGTFATYLSDISAWGPTDDGRIKPDVLSPGASIQSAENDGDVTTDNCGTRGSTGTSHASPGAGGSALLIRQYFEDGFYPSGSANAQDGFSPTAALVKAMLINSAVAIEFDAQGRPITIPSNEQGWGRVLLDNVMHFADQDGGLWVDDHSDGFTGPGDAPVKLLLEVLDSTVPLKVTLAWSDFPSTPAAATHLVNDLDLRVDGASGSFWGNAFRAGASWSIGEVDRVNNLEQVLVEVPTPGLYSIQITPHAIPAGPQPWALVVSGSVAVSAGPRPGYFAHTIDDSGPRGNGDGVLDPGESAIIPITLRNSGDADANAVIANLYSTHPDLLKVYDGAAAYPNMTVNAQGTSAAPHFGVTLEPSAGCGQWLGATMGVAGDGFEVGSALTLVIGEHEAALPSTDTPVAIPKTAPDGVNSFLTVDQSFPISDVDVTVNIDHGDISHLRVVLYAPDNTLVFLHDFGSPGVSGLHTTFGDPTEPAQGSMDDFLAVDPRGTWRIRIIDNVGGGTPAGTLQNWTLRFKSDIPFDCNPVGCGESVPPAVNDTLTVNPSGTSDVEVAWSGVGASAYNVWRSEDPQLRTATLAGSTGGATSSIDAGARNLPGVHYYVVRSVNSCRWESP